MDDKQRIALKDLEDISRDPKISDLARKNAMLQITAIKRTEAEKQTWSASK